MLLSEKIQQDIKSAMKEGRRDAVGALRMLSSALKNKQIELQRPLADEDVVRVVQGAIKQRKDSAQQYADAGRADLAAKELAEIEQFQAYLPAQLSDADLDGLVARAVAAVGATGPKDMGAVMKHVLAASAGRAEGSVVSAKVRARLG